MIYTLLNWTARAGTRLNRFKKTIEADGYVDLVNEPVEVTQAGTPLSVENLNHMDEGIKGANDDVEALKTTVAGKQATITGAATTIASANLAASMALVSDASGKVAAHASVTATELGYLDGVSSRIQTQINNANNAISTKAGVDTTTTSATATSFPIGHIVFAVYTGGTAVTNGAIAVYANGNNYSTTGSSGLLAGTWRIRGWNGGSNNGMMIQRVA